MRRTRGHLFLDVVLVSGVAFNAYEVGAGGFGWPLWISAIAGICCALGVLSRWPEEKPQKGQWVEYE